MPRLTSHGEVVFQPVGKPDHPYWGQHKDYWPHPIQNAAPAAGGGCGACGSPPPPPEYPSLAAWYEAAKAKPSDFGGHVQTLKELADGCEAVAEVSLWDDKPAVVALVASGATRVISVCAAPKRVWGPLRSFRPDFMTTHDDGPVRDGVDLLFFDVEHRAEVVYQGLAKYAPTTRKYLVVHCTTDPYGETGDDGGPGVMPGVRRFLQENPGWVVKRFDQQNHGLIVLSRVAEDKTPVKFGVRDVFRYAKAQLKHKLNGGKLLPLPLAQERIDQCVACDKRGGAEGGNCSVCKCYLFRLPADSTVNPGGPGKVFFPLELCPIGKWHQRPQDGADQTPEQVADMLDRAFGGSEAE